MGKDKLPAIVESWRAHPAPASHQGRGRKVFGRGETRGISFQFPPGWDDGSGKVQHVKSGPFKGRVCFTSKHEAKEVAARHEGKSGIRTRYDS